MIVKVRFNQGYEVPLVKLQDFELSDIHGDDDTKSAGLAASGGKTLATARLWVLLLCWPTLGPW